MKVCLLASTSAFGGVERHLASLAQALVSASHAVYLIVTGGNELLDDAPRLKGVEVVRIPASHGRVVSLAKLVRKLRQIGPDVCVHAKGSVLCFGGSITLLASLLTKRVVTIEHSILGAPPTKGKRRYFGVIPRFGFTARRKRWKAAIAAKCPDTTIAVSGAVQSFLLNEFGFSHEKVRVVHNGVNVETFSRDAEERAEMRASLGVRESTCVFGAIGRFQSGKRFVFAIEAFANLLHKHPAADCHLVFAGEGPDAEEMKQTISQRGIDGRVTILPYTPTPWKVLSALDVFLMPSESEGHPYSLLEAMACECMPIAFGVGGIPEVLVDPALGTIVSAGDKVAFEAAMEHALCMKESDRVAYGTAARRHVVQNFEEKAQMAKCVTLVESAA